MTLEKELLDFTNWLHVNNWELIGNGECKNTTNGETTSIKSLALQSCSFSSYYPQDFQAGDRVRDVDTGEIIEITEVIYNKFDEEYQYWFEEDGEEVFGFAHEFEKID